jgi:hypothetical protein
MSTLPEDEPLSFAYVDDCCGQQWKYVQARATIDGNAERARRLYYAIAADTTPCFVYLGDHPYAMSINDFRRSDLWHAGILIYGDREIFKKDLPLHWKTTLRGCRTFWLTRPA